MKNSDAYAIVLGLGGSNALGVVRSLGYEGIPVIGIHIKGRKPHASYSRYLQQTQIVNGEDELLERMIHFGEVQDKKGVVFPTGDDYIVLCDKYFDDLRDYYHIPNIPGKKIKTLLDKEQNLHLGTKAGFNTPKSTYLTELDDINGTLIVKPLTSIKFNKNNIGFYETIDSLLEDKEKLLQDYGEMSVQEFIPGGYDNLFEIHTYNSSKKGPLIIGMQQNKLGIIKRPHVYVGAIFESVWIDEIEENVINLTNNLDFNGPLDINLKKSSRDNKYYFLEVNFRTSANLILDSVAGFNLPAIIYYDKTGQDFESLISSERRIGIQWLHEERIMQYLKKHSYKQLLSVLKEVRTRVFWDNSDPIPFLKEIL